LGFYAPHYIFDISANAGIDYIVGKYILNKQSFHKVINMDLIIYELF
jgi:hypothetical protein